MIKQETETKKEPALLQYIRSRVIDRNKNFMMLFVGATGSGKSYAALRLAELVDKTFTIDRCCFRAKDFMNVINGLSQNGKSNAGKVILWDEFGVEHSSREFMTISNRVVNYFFQTCRHLNLVVIMTVPLASFIDSSTRKLMHSIAEMQGINIRKKTAAVKVKMLQVNVLTGKEYPKYLRYRKKTKRFVSKRFNFNLPSKKLCQDYEEKKTEFTRGLNKEIMAKLGEVEVKQSKTAKSLTPTQENVLQMLRNNSVEDVANTLCRNESSIYAHKKAMEKKGVVFNPIWQNNRVIGYRIDKLQ